MDIVKRYHGIEVCSNNGISTIKPSQVFEHNVDIYHPINYPALLEVLNEYLYVHGLLKLLSVSKTLYVAIQQTYLPIHIHDDVLLEEAMGYHCPCSYDMIHQNENQNNSMLWSFICPYGRVDYEKKVKFSHITHTTKIKTWIHDASRHSPIICNQLLTTMVSKFGMDDDYVELLCRYSNKPMIMSMINLFDTKKQAITLLPYAFKFHCMTYGLLKKLDNAELVLLFQSYQNNIVIQHDIIHVMIRTLPVEKEIILPWLCQHGNKEEWDRMFENFDHDEKVKYVDYAYQHQLEGYYLVFLNTTKDLNLLSIDLSIKYNHCVINTKHLKTSDVMQYVGVKNIDIIRKFVNCINHDDEPALLLYTDALRVMIQFIITQDDIRHIIHTMASWDMDVELKTLLTPMFYLHGVNTKNLEYLSSSKE